MTPSNDERLPQDLREVVEELRAHRTEASALELDRLKRRAMMQASRASASPQGQGLPLRSKLVTIALVFGFAVSAGAAGVIAGGGGGGGTDPSAAKSQYRPGKGCGDQNHVRPKPGQPPPDCPPPP